MKVCVVGAGAIGGYMAVHIANSGHEVSVVARGAHLAAIKTGGLRLIDKDNELTTIKLTATDCISDLAPQDVVLLALKAHQITPILNDLDHLFDSDTIMVTLQNGIPWWYFQNFGGGLPVTLDGEVVGGIGLSSGTPQQDIECAQAGIDHFLNNC